jgi:hypothetical protein
LEKKIQTEQTVNRKKSGFRAAPLFSIIFRPEVLKFHPYSILTGQTMVFRLSYVRRSLDNILEAVWQPSGSHLAAVWQPSGSRLAAVWQPSGSRLAAVWQSTLYQNGF